MKYFRILAQEIGLSSLMMILWGIAMAIAQALFGSLTAETSSSDTQADPSAGILLIVVCLLNTAVILLFIYSTKSRGVKLFGLLTLMIFGLQTFMTQIETIWFNERVGMTSNMLMTLFVSGGIMAVTFAAVCGVIFRKRIESIRSSEFRFDIKGVLKSIVVLCVFAWPAIYILAGHFIAWQFEAVREYYGADDEVVSLTVSFENYFSSGLYWFQILRGALWLLIIVPILFSIEGTMVRKYWVVSLILSILVNSQLLLPNPFMPEPVRMAHLIETSTSNFLWGLVIVFVIEKFAPVRTMNTQVTPQ